MCFAGPVAELLTIGEVSRGSGVAASALRFYEDRGLISSERSGSGHRSFRRPVLRRVAFIVFAQRVGLTLEEISAELAKLPDDHHGIPGAKTRRHVFGSGLALLRLAGDRDLDLITATGNRSLFEIPGGRHGLVCRHATAYDLRRRLGHRDPQDVGDPSEWAVLRR